MKQIIVLIAFTSVLAIALGRKSISMESVATQYIDHRWAKCTYEQSLGGTFRISIMIEGSQYTCPHEIHFDQDEGTWEAVK